MLIILGGLPGVGKSTVGRALAEKINAVYLRVDTIKHAIKTSEFFDKKIMSEGYDVACGVAKDNLDIDLNVIVDSVNPVYESRESFRNTAKRAYKPFFEVEFICSDITKHKARVNNRAPYIEGFQQPTWADILKKEYKKWDTVDLVVDTSEYSITQSVEMTPD